MKHLLLLAEPLEAKRVGGYDEHESQKDYHRFGHDKSRWAFPGIVLGEHILRLIGKVALQSYCPLIRILDERYKYSYCEKPETEYSGYHHVYILLLFRRIYSNG